MGTIYRMAEQAPTTIAVRGSAELEVAPDYALISVTALVRADDKGEAVEDANEIVGVARQAVEAAEVRSVRFGRLAQHRERYQNKETGAAEDGMWVVAISGSVEVDVEDVSYVAGVLSAADLLINGITWLLETDNPAHRLVRKAAVDDAFVAAADFADAISAKIGRLATLADPGLSSSGAGAGGLLGAIPRGAIGGFDSSEEIDLDPSDVVVRAWVEAVFEIA